MNNTTLLVCYCLAVVVFSLLGGYVPFRGKVTHDRLQFYLSLSAGVMLGASFFHVMPEAMEMAQGNFGWWMSLGVVGLFCIERFIAPHSHEIDGSHHHHHKHEHGHKHTDEHKLGELNHGHDHGHVVPPEHRAAAPAVAGWMAVLGLTIHTFMNGVGLAGSVEADTGLLGLPGIAMFLAIVFHKPADALAISTVLSRKGVSRQRITLVQLGFALMVPVGALAFRMLGDRLEEQMRNQLTGAALAFSAGTFLFIALSDLLPEVQFHRHDRMWLFLALTTGVAFMGGIALLEGHDHGHGGHEHGAQSASQHPHDEKGHHDKDEDDHEHHKSQSPESHSDAK
jgi:zinc and cadmium transporter